MKKIIMTVLVCCTCLLVAQDIAGSYRATGQRVEYQFYTRPNVDGSTTYAASGEADGSTSLRIHDVYGLGVTQSVANIPVGYNFYENIVGPIGLAEMDALQYFLYVTLNEDGTGVIPEGSQVLASETVDCATAVTLAPLVDSLSYTSNLEAGLTVQPTMVTGQPNASPYVGSTAGSWSISGSSFFSFFPATPSAVIADFQLFGDEFAVCYGTCVATGAGGMYDPGSAEAHAYCGGVECAGDLHGFPGYPHPGATSGYIVEDVPYSFAPSNQYFGVVPDLHVEWHYIDGPIAETGLGDFVDEDEDLDGTVYDNILGYPALVSTYTNPACGFNYPILGDVTATFEALGMGGCVDYTVGGVDSAPGTSDANTFYLMDASLAPWGNFLTWNAVMYSQTGDATFVVDDSGSDMNPADIFYIDALTGAPCNPADGSPTCAIPVNLAGGRLVMAFDPTCIPVLSSISVLGELSLIGGECDSGDTNNDGNVDVLDVVSVVGFILGQTDSVDCGDVNSDGNVDVLDVVAMVSGILGGRGEEASSATFTKTEDGVSMASNGVVGAVQMTLSHGSDFSLDLTDNAFVAEYHTEGSTTTLIVVSPTEDMLFEANGDFTVEEAVAATTDGYINTNVNIPDAITLGAAYPNPFNPSTSFELNVNQAGNISVMIYNVNGQIVDVLHQGYKDAGVHSMTLNGQNLSSGMYIVKATSADVTVSQKVMLIK